MGVLEGKAIPIMGGCVALQVHRWTGYLVAGPCGTGVLEAWLSMGQALGTHQLQGRL